MAEGVVQVDAEGRYQAKAPRTLDFVRGTLLHLIEGYWIAADSLRALANGAMEVKQWLEHAREHGEREFLEGDVRRAEAFSQAILRNALTLFREEGLVVLERRGTGKKTVEYVSLAPHTRLEQVENRRNELGTFLVTHREDPIPRPADAGTAPLPTLTGSSDPPPPEAAPPETPNATDHDA
jgi:hypothetical protein